MKCNKCIEDRIENCDECGGSNERCYLWFVEWRSRNGVKLVKRGQGVVATHLGEEVKPWIIKNYAIGDSEGLYSIARVVNEVEVWIYEEGYDPKNLLRY